MMSPPSPGRYTTNQCEFLLYTALTTRDPFRAGGSRSLLDFKGMLRPPNSYDKNSDNFLGTLHQRTHTRVVDSHEYSAA